MKLFDYIFLLRPMLIIPVWTISLLGARAALWHDRGLSPFLLDHFPFSNFTSGDIRLLIMLGLATLLTGGVFVVNQIYDVESDKKNGKLFLLADGHLTISTAWTIYFVVTLLAIGGAFILNWQLGVLFVAGAAIGLQYSHPRFKVRKDAYKSMRNNILGHGMLALLFGWVMYQNFDIEGILKSVPYMFAVGAVYLNTTLPDMKGDKAAHKTTYALTWGVEKTQLISLVHVVAALILSIMAADYAFAIAAGISLPFFIAAKASGEISQSVLASKVAILLLSLFASLFFPPYLLLLVLTIIITRAYYAKRFSLSYPVLWERGK
ncbi:MAG: UbiA family prenyltransferase [bacterium]